MNERKAENDVARPGAAPTGGRMQEIDALRGIAVLGVVVWHYIVHFGATPLSPNARRNWRSTWPVPWA